VAIGSDSPPPVEVNDAPAFTSAAAAITLTEWADNSTAEAANTGARRFGQIAFTDADAGDVHAASFVAQGTGYLGQFSLTGVDQAAELLRLVVCGHRRRDRLSQGRAEPGPEIRRHARRRPWRQRDADGDDHPRGNGRRHHRQEVLARQGQGGRQRCRSDTAADIHWFLEMQQDQAPAPQPVNAHPGFEVPEMVLTGLYSPMFGSLFGEGLRWTALAGDRRDRARDALRASRLVGRVGQIAQARRSRSPTLHFWRGGKPDERRCHGRVAADATLERVRPDGAAGISYSKFGTRPARACSRPARRG
jgi:hypothetical protein